MRLHQCIENKRWEEAKALLYSNEGMGMVKEKNATNSLPLHWSFNFSAPDDFLLALIQMYEPAVRMKNATKRLPIHCAVERGSTLAVIEALVRAYPESLDQKDKWGKTPRDIARNGNMMEGEASAAVLRSTDYWIDLIGKENIAEIIFDECEAKLSKLDSAVFEKLNQFEENLNIYLTALNELSYNGNSIYYDKGDAGDETYEDKAENYENVMINPKVNLEERIAGLEKKIDAAEKKRQNDVAELKYILEKKLASDETYNCNSPNVLFTIMYALLLTALLCLSWYQSK